MPESDTETTPYGHPGAPISRQTPFNRGFLFTLGGLSALVLGFAVAKPASVLVLVLISALLAVGLDPLVRSPCAAGVKRGWAVLRGRGAVLRRDRRDRVRDRGRAASRRSPSSSTTRRSCSGTCAATGSIAKLDTKYHVLSGLQDQDPGREPVVLDAEPDLRRGHLGGQPARSTPSSSWCSRCTSWPRCRSMKRGRCTRWLRPSRRERVEKLGDAILRSVGGYVIGAVGVALLAGTVTLILLLSVGLSEYALPLALLVALLDLVPLLGSIVGATVVSLVGFATSLSTGIACVIFYAIYETLEGYVIYPRVMRSSVDIPEYVTIVAVLIGGRPWRHRRRAARDATAAALLLLIREVWVAGRTVMTGGRMGREGRGQVEVG